MAYDKGELETLAIKAIEENNLVNISEVVSFLPILSRATFYNLELDKLDSIKEALSSNKISTKVQMRKKWFESDNATLQISLYKLISEDEERKKLSQSYMDHTSGGKTITLTPEEREAKIKELTEKANAK